MCPYSQLILIFIRNDLIFKLFLCHTIVPAPWWGYKGPAHWVKGKSRGKCLENSCKHIYFSILVFFRRKYDKISTYSHFSSNSLHSIYIHINLYKDRYWGCCDKYKWVIFFVSFLSLLSTPFDNIHFIRMDFVMLDTYTRLNTNTHSHTHTHHISQAHQEFSNRRQNRNETKRNGIPWSTGTDILVGMKRCRIGMERNGMEMDPSETTTNNGETGKKELNVNGVCLHRLSHRMCIHSTVFVYPRSRSSQC